MEDRDEKGHFIKGHKSLGGRPKGTKKAQLLIRWDKLCKGKHTDRVYYALLDAALSGDVAAIRLYLQYALGSPKEEMEITHKEEVRNIETIRQEFNLLFRKEK